MAITENVTKQAITMKLNNGYDAQGNIKTVNLGLGSLSATGYNAQKALNIVEDLTACLSKSVVEVQHVQTSTLIDD